MPSSIFVSLGQSDNLRVFSGFWVFSRLYPLSRDCFIIGSSIHVYLFCCHLAFHSQDLLNYILIWLLNIPSSLVRVVKSSYLFSASGMILACNSYAFLVKVATIGNTDMISRKFRANFAVNQDSFQTGLFLWSLFQLYLTL